MGLARLRLPLLVATTLVACSGGEGTGTSSPMLGGSSTEAVDDSTGATTASTTAPPPGTGGGTTTNDPDTTTGPGMVDSSSGPGCVPGSLDCSCDAGSCAQDLVCLADTCVELNCDGDLFEPNDDEANAYDLGEINDNDDNGGVVSASLHTPGDVDWYQYQGDDDVTGNVNPEREVVASAGLRLCKFLECNVGLDETEFECPVGTQYGLSPMGRAGCCAEGGVALPDLNCTGTFDDSATVYIRVDAPERPCVTYSVAYHY